MCVPNFTVIHPTVVKTFSQMSTHGGANYKSEDHGRQGSSHKESSSGNHECQNCIAIHQRVTVIFHSDQSGVWTDWHNYITKPREEKGSSRYMPYLEYETRQNEWDLGSALQWRMPIMTQAERRADLYRSRWSWRNPNRRGTWSSMRDRTWHDIKPRSKGRLSPLRSRCLLGPPHHQQAAEALCYPPSTKLKSASLGANISKSLQSQSQEPVRDKRREENKSFLNVFVVQKIGVVIFFELALSNVWCSEWPKPWGESVCWKSIYHGTMGGSGGVLRLRWRHRLMCWKGGLWKVVMSAPGLDFRAVKRRERERGEV